jgi:malonyl-CoA/methylmalonyl-CoA synthetase
MSLLLQAFSASVRVREREPALDLGPAEGPVSTLAFGEVAGRGGRMARALASRGVRAGDRVAVQLANRVEMIDLFLGCLELGAMLVPVNVLYRERELGHILGDAESCAMVTTPDLASRVPSGTVVWDVGALAEEATSGGEGTGGGAGAARRAVGADLDDATPAVLVYTSGTTGRAKGAVLTHGNLAANARNLLAAWRITHADRYLAVLPLFHVHGLGNGVCSWLASGCRMRLVERFEHEKALALFEESAPTLFFGVPTIYRRLLDWPEEAARRVGARARLFVSGSAPLPASVFERFRAMFGHAILERYGMTETLMTLGNPLEGERRPGTVGQPFPGVEARIVDEDGRDVESGEVGKLLVRGPTAFPGYWRRPDATAAAFADGWFRTGDLARRSPDGYYTLEGRASDLVITGGFNVYPREVEAVLLEQPGVREVAVAGAPDERKGEVPVAWFVGDADPVALTAACRAALASFKVPRTFVRVAALPRNALGKVQKHLLPPPPRGPE